MNPFSPTAKFWFNAFKSELVFGSKTTAEEYFIRYRYFKRREHLWVFLSELCQQKEFGAKERQ